MNINHTNCPHSATKAARAKCRKAHTEAPAQPTIESLVAIYYDGTGDLVEEIAAGLAMLGVDTTGYYNNDLTAEEFIASVIAPKTPCTPEACTCTEVDRTETIMLTRGPKVKVCKVAAIAHYEARLDRVDRNLAFAQQGGERTKRDTYMRKLRALKA